MPRLFHRPPLYRLHKSTKQAVVSFFGNKIYLGPYGSPRSHERYQEILKNGSGDGIRRPMRPSPMPHSS